MNHLSDFKPLARVELPGIADLRCSGLTIIVGPNSSGKSQFLKDLYARLSGDPRKLIVAKEVLLNKPEFGPLMECLKSEGYFDTHLDNAGNEKLRALTTYLGTGQAIADDFTIDQARTWHKQNAERQDGINGQPDIFLQRFGRLLVTALFLERRLMSLNQVGVIDFQNNPVANDLHALYLNDNAKKKLSDELLKSFNKGVWLDHTQGTVLCFRYSDQPELPSAEDRLSHTKMAQYRTIETEGDGLRSYVATAVALLLGRRPICLIDEPEMCLHPPQAHNLGRFIGVQGSSLDTATFVATHSSEVLRGALSTGKDIQVVRLTRRQGAFQAHLLPAFTLMEAIAKPTVRAESVLDGIFAESVVVVEAEGDRLLYQTVWETLADDLRQDVHFTTVGGTGGIPDICRLYKALSVPIAVITDLDILADPAQLGRVLYVMTTPANADALKAEAYRIMELIRALPPAVMEAEIRQGLRRILEAPTNWANWTNDGDIEIRKEINKISQKLDHLRRLTQTRVSTLPDDIRQAINKLLEDLRIAGVFLVPVGELEDWLANENIPESKANKSAWANAAALRILSKGQCTGDIWDFVRGVDSYLSRQ
ncbi:MAG: AAA family ATPase [Dehalococcoidia bacterium]|nr:AAA family ATPase [Dehalococcoidia bacterium]